MPAFHRWLAKQDGHPGRSVTWPRDYLAGVRDSDHDPADGPDSLRRIINAITSWDLALDAVEAACEKWKSLRTP